MQFAYWLGNHNTIGQRSLEDVIGIMGHQLRALGHKAVWDNTNRNVLRGADGYNVVVEGFTRGEHGSINMLAKAHAEGARFICLATEEPTDKGFNHGKQREMVLRQETFCEAAPYFSGILHLVPGEHVTKWYGQFAPTAQAELGFAPTLIRGDATVPIYNFGFFGSISRRRMKILKKLARRIGTQNAVRVVGDFSSQQKRDEAMKTCRVIVQIRKFEEMGLVSSSRCNTALSVGRPIVAEPHLLSKPWDEVVRFTQTMDEFYDICVATQACWRAVHEDQFCKFKVKLSPEYCVGKPLRDIGILPGGERRAA